jgi:hypothetical protein
VTQDLNIASIEAIPPIVLLVDDDRDTLDMYSTHFEREGLWVASATCCASTMRPPRANGRRRSSGSQWI